MAKIKVTSKCAIYDGMIMTFKAPCDCTVADGLNVYFQNEKQTFFFRDAHGNDVSGIDDLFKIDTYVTVSLDTTNGYAYLQNADTNAYLEEALAGKSNTTHGHKLTDSVITGTLPIERGGTGATVAEDAKKNIGAKIYFSLAEIGITPFPTTMSAVCSKMPTQSIMVIDSRNIISGGAEEISDLGLAYSGMYVFFKGNTVSRFSLLFMSGSTIATSSNMFFGCYSSTSNEVVWERTVKNKLTSNEYGTALPDAGTAGRIFFKRV